MLGDGDSEQLSLPHAQGPRDYLQHGLGTVPALKSLRTEASGSATPSKEPLLGPLCAEKGNSRNDSGQGDEAKMAAITVQIDSDFVLCLLQELTFQN